MRTAEKIVIGSLAAGLIFKIQHWPFGGLILITSISALALFYFPLGVLWFGRPTRKDQVIWFSLVSGLALSTILIGHLFKLQHWPLADAHFLLGTVCCAVIAVVSLFLRSRTPGLAGYFRGILLRASILGGLGALAILGRSLRPEQPLIDTQVKPEDVVAPTVNVRSDWARQISDSAATGVFVLWEPDSNRMQISDSARAHTGFLPASTFKVFNSLVALQERAVSDQHAIIPWDGVRRRSADWNEDQDMAQAIARSTVWWYQEVARRAGAERMQYWLDTVGYGNGIMGDSIHLFWLQGGLRITPLEQVRFMQRLHEEELPFDVAHQRTVKSILPADSTASWTLQGKTGWAIRVEEEYGWYVGWVERAGRTAYFALNIDIREMVDVSKRYTLTYALLQKEGWIDP